MDSEIGTTSLVFPRCPDRLLGTVTYWDSTRCEGRIDGYYYFNASRILRYNFCCFNTVVEFEIDPGNSQQAEHVVPYFNDWFVHLQFLCSQIFFYDLFSINITLPY
jgi:hypothetical protein